MNERKLPIWVITAVQPQINGAKVVAAFSHEPTEDEIQNSISENRQRIGFNESFGDRVEVHCTTLNQVDRVVKPQYSKNKEKDEMINTTNTENVELTCKEASKITEVGSCIHWRPNGKVNHLDPDNDIATVIG